MRFIERLDLLPEQPLRPSVIDEMMKLDHQRMIVVVELQQLGAQQGLRLDIQGLAQQDLPLLEIESGEGPQASSGAEGGAPQLGLGIER